MESGVKYRNGFVYLRIKHIKNYYLKRLLELLYYK